MKNLITYLKALWSWVSGSQRKKIGVTLGEATIEHPFSTYSAPFGTCWQPSGKLHSVVRCAAMLVMLFTIGSGNAWGEEKTITLTHSSFSLTTTYAKKTATVSSIGFTVDQGYKGTGNVIQMNSSKGSGILYNTTAIKGLKSIEVTVSSGSKTYTITTGTSEKPTANSQTGTTTKTFNAKSGDTYFQLKVSGASYFSKIVITYDDAATFSVTVKSPTGRGAYTDVSVTDKTKMFASGAFSQVVAKHKACTWSNSYMEAWNNAYVDYEISKANKVSTKPTNSGTKHIYTTEAGLPSSGTLYPLFVYGGYYYTEATCPTLFVNYDSNGATSGTAPSDGNNYDPGDDVTVLGQGTLTRTNYTFTGWNTESDGSGTHYDAGDQFDMPDEDVTLYAEWCKDLSKSSITVNEPTLTSYNSGTGKWTVNVTWTAVDGATYYTVQCGDRATSAVVLSETNVGNVTSYTINNLTNAHEHRIIVTAKHACDATQKQGKVDFTPTCDKDVSAVTPTVNATTSITKTGATANWTAVSDADHYTVKVYAGATATGSAVKTYTNVTGTSQAITGLTAGTQYCVTVQAHDACSHDSQIGTGGVFTTTALTLYTVTFHNAAGSAPSAVTQTTENGTVSIPSASACDGWTFVGWKIGGAQSSTTTDPTSSGTWITNATWPKNYTPSGNIDAYAVFKHTEGGSTPVNDVLNQTWTGVTGTSYSTLSDKAAPSSTAVYSVNCAGSNSSIQLRSSSSSGVVQTTSGGNVTKVTVVWESHTSNDRTLDVYGKNSAYESYSDLFSATPATQGTLLGSIVCGTSTELTIDGDYAYIGFRSRSGAMYLTSVTITIGGGGTTTWRSDPPCCEKLDAVGGTWTTANNISIDGTNITATVKAGNVVANASGYRFVLYNEAGTSEIAHKDVNSNSAPVSTTFTSSDGVTLATNYKVSVITLGDGSTYCDEGNESSKIAANVPSAATWIVTYNKNTTDEVTGMPASPLEVLQATGSGTLSDATPTRTGYTFGGWSNTSGSGNTADYSAGGTISGVTADKTIYAVWTAKPTYTITLNAGNGTISDGSWTAGVSPTWTQTQAHGDASITFPTASCNCAGWVFQGWKLGSAADDQSSFTPDQTEGSSLVPTGNVTYYAVYRQNSTGGTTYNKITDIGDLTTGTYVIKTSSYAMRNNEDVIWNSTYYRMPESSKSGADASITNSDATLDWTIIKFGSNYAIKSGSKFVGIDGDGILVYDETMHLFTAAYDGTNNRWVFTSTENTSYQLVYSTYFRSLDTQNTAILLYKQGAGLSGNYYTNPVCSDYTVTGVANPAAGGSVTLSATSGKTGDKIYAYYTKDPAYNFENWSVSGTGATLSSTTDQYTELTIGTADVTLTANFVEKVMYSVSWVVNNAPYSTGTPSSSIEGGSKWSALTLPTAPADNTLNDCDRTKFVGWSTSTLTGDGNSAPSDLFKTTSDANADSHTITGNTTFYAVFAKGGGDTNWQITGDDIDILDPSGNSTYTKRNGDHTKSGITFNTSQVTTNNSQLQFQASAGVLYNKTAMPENITSIVLTTNALKVYQKSTVISSTAGLTDITPTGTGPYTYTFDDGNKYFCVKKTTSGAGYSDYLRVNYAGSSTDYVTSCACSWQINYITNGKKDGDGSAIWSTDNCFQQVGETHEWQIENFAMPNVAGQFWVGPGYFKGPGDWGHSVIADLSTVKYVRRSDKVRTDYSAVSNMIGTLNVWDNGGDDNYHVGIYPDYQITYGVDGGVDPWSKVDFTYKSSTRYETDVVTAPTYFAVANFKYYVGVKTDGNTGYGGKSSTAMMNTMTGMTSSQDGKHGLWRFEENSSSNNWGVTWIPYYVLSYDANGGTGAPSAETAVSSEGDALSRTKTVSSTVPTRDGYTFIGWNTAPGGDGTAKSAGDNIVLTSDVTLYAQWRQNFTVTYDLGGGTASPACSGGTYYVGETVSVCGSTPTRVSSEFTGWLVYKTGDKSTTVTVSAGQFTMPAYNVTVEAQYTTVYWRITYKTEGDATIATDDVPRTMGTTLRNETPCVGYSFVGWSTSKITVETTTKPTATLIGKGGASYTPDADITVYPVYARVEGASDKNDVITKDINGGSGSYTAFSNVSYVSDAKYAGCTTVQSSTDLSFNASNGIVTTTSGGRIKHVQVVFATGCTQPRSLYVYGKNTAYSTFVQNGFPTGASAGTLIATATKTTLINTGEVTVELPAADTDFEDEYNYIALGADNSLRITSIKVTWSAGTTYYATHCETKTDVTITYDANGGTTTCGNGSHQVTWDYADGGAGAPTLASAQTICASATRSGGYILRDWTTSQDGTGTHYTPGQTVTSMDGDKTLYAQWDRVYTVTFNNQGVTTPVTQASEGATIAVPSASSACSAEWAFVGWSETEIAPMSLLPTLEITAGTSTYTPTADKTLYAIYRKTSTSDAFVAGMSGAYKIKATKSATDYYATTAGTKLDKSTNSAEAVTYYIKYSSADGGKYTIQHNDGKYIAYKGKPASVGAHTDLQVSDDVFYWRISSAGGGLWAVQSPTSTDANTRYLQLDNEANPPTGFKAYHNGINIAFVATEGQYYYRTMSCEDEFDITFHDNGTTINWADGHPEATYKDLADATVVTTFPTATFDGWTFLGWRRSDYAESTTAPESATIFGGSNGTSGNSLTISSANEDLYPVFTRFEDNAPFDEINGGDYYIYYLAAGTNDGYGNAKRVYAATYDGEKRYNSTALCASATTFTFEKLANGKWTIYDNTTHKYLCDKADNWLCQQNDPAEWTITVASGNQFDAYSTHSDYHIIAYDYGGGASTAIFQNYYAGNLTTDPSQYHRVYLGSCTNRTFTTNPSTTPYITMNGEVAPITSSQNGAIRATNVLSVSGGNLTPSTGEITISSDNGDIYFSLSTDKNFARAAADQPKSSVTITANGSGVVTPTPVYIHYKPSSNTDTWTSVTVTASYPGAVSQTATIELRIVKENFAIAAKVAGSWYALPANMGAEGVFEPVLIDVDESAKIAYGPATVGYKMWPVQTVNGGTDEYAANGDKVRFAGNSNAGLWASNSNNYIRNWATITAIGSTAETPASYEWIIETADRNAYTLKSMYSTNYLDLYRPTSGGNAGKLVWASNGDYVTNEVHFFPLEERATINIIPREWKTNGLVFAIAADNNISLTSGHTTAKIGTGDAASATITRHSTGGYGLYEVALPDLTSHYGKVLTLKMKISGVDTYATATIPIIVNANASTKTSEPFATLDGDAKNYDVVVLSGKTLTTNASASEACKFQNLYLYPGATLVNTANGNLSVSYLEMRGGIKGIDAKSSLEQDVPRLLLGKSMSSTAGANLDMYVNTAHSYALSVPFDVTLSNVNFANSLNTSTSAPINGTLDAQFMIMEYDGAQRVSTGKGWKHITSTERVLHAGEGYVLQGKRPKGQPFAVIRFPFTGVNSWADNTNGEVAKSAIPIYAHNGGATTPDNEKGWNLIANPYMATISYSGQDEGWAADFTVGTLEKTDTDPWDGKYEWESKTNAYVTMPNDSYTAFPQYRANSAQAVFKPFMNFFIQTDADGSVTFDRSLRASAPRHLLALAAKATPIYADINLTHGEAFAQAGLTIDENATAGYKFGEDQNIFENREALDYLKVYTVADGHYLVGNTLTPEETSELIPLEFYAPNVNGDYVFSLDANSDIDRLEYVILYDAELGLSTNLLTNDYSVELTGAGLITERFSIGLKIKEKDNSATGIDDVGGNPEQPYKFIYRDKMYIMRGGHLYDATGKQVREIQ